MTSRIYLAKRLQLEDDIRRDTRLTQTARNVCIELIRRRNFETGQCNISVPRIAQALGCGIRSVDRALAALEEAAWLQRISGKGRSSNQYVLPRLEGREAPDPGTGHNVSSRQNGATTEASSRQNGATTETLSRHFDRVVAPKCTSLSRQNGAQSLIEISASDLSLVPAAETTSPRKAFEAECRRMVEPEPIMLAQDFHVIEELLDREGLKPEDICTGISEALERRSDPRKRFRHWRQMVGWCRGAAINRLAMGPRASSSASRPTADNPDDPMLEFPGGFKRRTSFVVRAIVAWHARPGSWPMTDLGAPPGSPGCRVPLRLLKGSRARAGELLMSNVTPLDLRRGTMLSSPPLPESIEAEQAILGAVLMNAEAFAFAASIVRPEHFSQEIHRRIFDVMGNLMRAGRPITMAGLLAFLGDHELGEGVSTQRYLANLARSASAIITAPENARIVRETAARRALISAAAKISEAAYDARVDVGPDDVAAEGLELIRSLLADAPRGRARFALGEGAADLIDRMERTRRGEEQPRGLATGFHDLNTALGGLQPGTLVVVAARVAMGKTVVMTNLADGVARRNHDVGVLEFSLEIPADQLQARHLAARSFNARDPITFAAILKGGVDDLQAERVMIAQRALSKLPIVVECPPKITADEIAARIHVEKRAMAAKGVRLGVVLIDYLDKIASSDRYAGQRTYEIQEIVTILKSAALAEDVCLVLLAQLNRGTEGREDRRPTLADLKSSSFIEQEAHAVIFVYREAYYLLKSAAYRESQDEALRRFDEAKNDVELIIGKNRGGPETTVHLWGDVSCSYLAQRDRGSNPRCTSSPRSSRATAPSTAT